MKRLRVPVISGLIALVAFCSPHRAMGAPIVKPTASPKSKRTPAVFALVIGVNKSVDTDLKVLRYADDDAANYRRLFAELGADVELLTRFDAASARLYPHVATHPPRIAALKAATNRLRERVASARRAGRPTMLYLAYAGHGRSRSGGGYVSLEDARLDATQLARDVLQRVDADRSHVIVDACSSFFLALSRGPGGKRERLAKGFSRLGNALRSPRVGLLLSTSSARESHEWQAFQAGVFSHTVRSGLRGAADVDGDGKVSYREIAAFVERANAAIANEKYRSQVFARAPLATSVLVDLGIRRQSAIRIGGKLAGRYLLEDEKGVRLADFHSAPGQALELLRPTDVRLYLRRVADDREYAIAPGGEPVVLARLGAPKLPHVASRGAAQHAFAQLFALPFGARTVASYHERATLPHGQGDVGVTKGLSGLSIARWTSLGLATASLGVAIALTISGLALKNDAPDDESQLARLERNDRIATRNHLALGFYVAGGVLAALTTTLFLWPESFGAAEPSQVARRPRNVARGLFVAPTGGGAQLGLRGSF